MFQEKLSEWGARHMRNCYCHKRWLIFDTLGFLYLPAIYNFFSKVRDGGKWHISKQSIAILVCDLRTQCVMMFQLVSIYTFPLLSRIFNFCNMNVFICIASKYFQYWIKIVLLYKLVILDLSSITGFKDIIVNHCYKFIKVML